MGTELPDPPVAWNELLGEDGVDVSAELRTIARLAALERDDVDHVAIWALEDELGPLRFVVAEDRSPDAHVEGARVRVDDAPAFLRAVQRSDVAVVEDAARDPRAKVLRARCPWLRGFGSLLLVPCRCDGRVVALLVYGRRGGPRPWPPSLRAEAPRVGALVGTLVFAAAGLVAREPTQRLVEAITQERRQFEQVLRQLPSGVLVSDPDGRIILQNEVSKQLFGFQAPSDAPSWGMASTHLRAPVSELPLFRALRDGEYVVREVFPFVRPDGQTLWLSVNAGPVYDDNGRVVAAVTAFDDVTEQRRNALELEEEGRLRERYMAILGHDLRTPAAAILMSAQLLRRAGPLDPKQDELVQRILTSARRMERMIGELLDLGRIRSGRIELATAPTDLAAVCEEVVEELRTAWPGRRLETDLEAPAVGHWDADRLAQVVSNLAANALEHGSPDHPVRLRLRVRDDAACLEVRNVGPPIPPELLENLHRPFHGAQRSTSPSGLGLGLYISHAMVSAHGGALTLEHTGSEVVGRVELPLRPPAEAAER